MTRFAMVLRRFAVLTAVSVAAAGCGGGSTGNTKTVTAPPGNAVRGKQIFAQYGCGNCHTFSPARTSATVGPNLDRLAIYAEKAHKQVMDFTRSAITNPPAPYVPPGFPTNRMPTTFALLMTDQQMSDLVVFLTKSSSRTS